MHACWAIATRTTQPASSREAVHYWLVQHHIQHCKVAQAQAACEQHATCGRMPLLHSIQHTGLHVVMWAKLYACTCTTLWNHHRQHAAMLESKQQMHGCSPVQHRFLKAHTVHINTMRLA